MLIFSLLFSLTTTLLLECSGGFFFGIRDKRDFLIILLANIVTNPPLVYIVYLFFLYTNGPWLTCVLISLELAAFFIEAIIYKKLLSCPKNPYLIAFALNAFSLLGGKLIEIMMKGYLL